MPPNFSISFLYRIKDRYSKVADKISRKTDKMRNKMKKMEARAGKMSAKMGGLQSTLGSVAAVIGGKAALDKYVAFEQAQNNLAAVSFTTEKNLKRMRDTAMKLGDTTKFTAVQATEGMHALKVGGLEVEEVLAAIPHTLNLAAAGALDLGTAAQISVKAMRQLELGVEDLAEINDVLALAQSKASFKIVELFEAMRPAAPMAHALNLSFAQIAAALGMIADSGQAGSTGGTQFASGLLMIKTQNPKKIGKALKYLGLQMSDIFAKTGKFHEGGFVTLIKQLENFRDRGGDITAMLKVLFGKIGLKSWIGLVSQGSERFEELSGMFEKADDAAATAAGLQMRGLPGILLLLTSALEGLNIAIFSKGGLDITLGKMFSKFTDWTRATSAANPVLLRLIGILGLVMVVLLPLVTLFGIGTAVVGSIAAAFGVALSPIIAVIAAVALLITAISMLVAYKKELKEFFQPVMKSESFIGAAWKIGTLAADPYGGIIKLLEKRKKFTEAYSKITEPEKAGLLGYATPFDITKTAAVEGRATQDVKLTGEISLNLAKAANEWLEVENASLETDIPGELGINMAGAK